jgi:hypothetical protein
LIGQLTSPESQITSYYTVLIHSCFLLFLAFFLDISTLEDEEIMLPQGNYVASESQEPFTQRCSVIFQKNGIVSYTIVRTS